MFEPLLEGPPFQIEVEEVEDGFAVMVALSCNQADQRIVSVETALEFTSIETEEVWEISFSIVVVSGDDSFEPFQTQDRDMAAPYIPAQIRPMVMPVVCESASALVKSRLPPAIYLVAKIDNLPEKAMSKYYMLIQALDAAGYALDRDGTDWAGRRFWLLRKKPS